MAPMAGITNLPFRLMVKRKGCGLVCSEMVSSNGLVYQSEKTENLLKSSFDEKPLSVQIFGYDPFIMAEAAKIAEEKGADIIDINFGCSVKKILKSGSGSALMKDLGRAEKIITSVRKKISIPLTIKIRSGWESSGEEAVNIAKIAQDSGAEAMAIHPRTVMQAFRGDANWSIIEKVKKNVSIPVIGNGDIKTCYDAIDMFKKTGCDAVMIGRAAASDPWIFESIKLLLDNKDPVNIDPDIRFETMIDYLKDSVKFFGEKKACFMMRSRLCNFVKGMQENSSFKESIRFVSSEAEALELIYDFKKKITI